MICQANLKAMCLKISPLYTDEEKLKELLQKLERYGGTPSVRALLRLSPYVFTRPSEVRLMKWAELDLNTGI